MVKPMTLWPSARSMAATAEESTPPDIATAMVVESVINLSQFVMNVSNNLIRTLPLQSAAVSVSGWLCKLPIQESTPQRESQAAATSIVSRIVGQRAVDQTRSTPHESGRRRYAKP